MHQNAFPTDIWIGSGYARKRRKGSSRIEGRVSLPHRNNLLILGESTYGSTPPLSAYIPMWASRRVTDATFTRLFNACSGLSASTATPAQRLAFWDSVAFYNFVLTPLPSILVRPTPALYQAGIPALQAFLTVYAPRGVWILGTGQAEFSRPVVEHHQIPYVVQYHPTSRGLPTIALKNSWQILKAIAL